MRRDTKSRLRGTRKRTKPPLSVRPLLDNRLGICSKIDKQSEFTTGKTKIVQQLSTMFLCQCLHGLDLDNDLPIAVEVGDVRFLYRHALVDDTQLLLCVERYAARLELPLKALL